MLMLQPYMQEVTPLKKGESGERYQAYQIRKTKLADMALDKITGEVVAQYRDALLKRVSENTLRLELTFLLRAYSESGAHYLQAFVISH